jgi:hypothetical protein
MKNPSEDIKLLHNYIESEKQFIFIRFSDGEIPILRNEKIYIKDNKVFFKGIEQSYDYPKWDEKTFNPSNQEHQIVRKDLLESALFNRDNYFKGIPTKHNKAIVDREFLIRLNGGFSNNLTFSDLFLNENYKIFRTKTLDLIKKRNICLISNFRATKPVDFNIIKHLKIGDNFFNNYDKTLEDVLQEANKLPMHTLILSSASSLSNIIGFKIYSLRPDLSLFDIGTSINDLIGMKGNSREYHILLSDNKHEIEKYKKRSSYKLKW